MNFVSPEGVPYYYNESRGVTQWEVRRVPRPARGVAPRPALAPVLASDSNAASREEMSTAKKVLSTLRRLRSVPAPPEEDSMLEPMRLTDEEPTVSGAEAIGLDE